MSKMIYVEDEVHELAKLKAKRLNMTLKGFIKTIVADTEVPYTAEDLKDKPFEEQIKIIGASK